MTTVTLSWSGPDAEEDAAEFRRLRVQYREHGWLPDTAWELLLQLISASDDITDSSEEEASDG